MSKVGGLGVHEVRVIIIYMDTSCIGYSGTSHNGPYEKATTDTCSVTDRKYHSCNTLATSEKRTLPDSGQRTKSLHRTALHHAFLPLNSGHPEATPLKLQSCACTVQHYV